ncbi:MAG: hypothetical protein Q9224_001126 [Gallowayella concinna]
MSPWWTEINSNESSISVDDIHVPVPSDTLVRTSTYHADSFFTGSKRKRSVSDSSSAVIEWDPENSFPEVSEKRHPSSEFAGIQPPPLVYPKTLYTGHEPPLPRTDEQLVLKEIAETEENLSTYENDDFISVDLENFSIYRPHQISARPSSRISTSSFREKTRSNELVSLQDLHDRASSSFCFDGVLCIGKDRQQQRYVQKIAFEVLSIGGYEDNSLHTVGPDIWLQSFVGKSSKIWYRLKNPATEYSRYYKPFVWVADLAKHLVDFIHARATTSLHDFNGSFTTWLATLHGLDSQFLSWRKSYPRSDFRHVVVAHATFLYNQAGQLGTHYTSQPLWGEIDPAALTAIPRQISQRKSRATVVTPFVHQCFGHLPWAKFLDPVDVPQQVTESLPLRHRNDWYRQARETSIEGPVEVGDVVAIKSDTNTSWKTKDEYWYAYVQAYKATKHGKQLSLIWIYRPADTACQHMKYPHSNELFMSDHCNCNDPAIYASEVAYKVRVSLFVDSTPQTEFFIRQKYSSEDCYWATLKSSDFRCQCSNKQALPQYDYNVGDTIFVRATAPKETLEPVVLLEHAPNHNPAKILVKRLLRKRDDYGDSAAEANELVYTSRSDLCDISAIVRRCYIRFYTYSEREQNLIPAPYNRSGAGDCYYILSEESRLGNLRPLHHPWPTMNQGFDPFSTPAHKPLRGLDIFCGGGNLGRGLEESQAVKNEWAVDYFSEAIHTYHANLQQPAKLFNGSVNDYLFQAIKGRGCGLIAQKGQVEMISAGSPCQGFSIANQRYNNDQSLLNISMVASVVAFVDYYRPKFVIMENVLGMANCGPKRTGQDNVFAQVLCALVGLGYQVRPMILDAWSFGAPQGRTRLFITAAAPGLEPIAIPPPSHSHPENVIGRSLGKTANGLPFGAREWAPTPFEFVSIGEATKDLPENVDARIACILYPDHRVTGNLSALDNIRLSCVPRFPPGMTFVKAAKIGWQPPPQMAAWHWGTNVRSNINSMAYQRTKSNALLPTLTTKNSPSEALTGSALHWDAHRCLTVMEARRAQGYPDEEIIIGSPSMQWKIVGNSVTRQVAISLGMGLRKPWLVERATRSEERDGFSAETDNKEQGVLQDVAGNLTQRTLGKISFSDKRPTAMKQSTQESHQPAVSVENMTITGAWEDSPTLIPDSLAAASMTGGDV